MEVMTDVLVGWVAITRNPSCSVSKAVARAGLATDRLTKIVGHHALRWRGLARRTNGGTGVRQWVCFLSVDFRNTRSRPAGTRFADVGAHGPINAGALRAGNPAAAGRIVERDCRPDAIARARAARYRSGVPPSPMETTAGSRPKAASQLHDGLRFRHSEGVSSRIHRVTGAGIAASAIPTTSSSPAAPGFVIEHRGIRITRFDRRAIGASGVGPRGGYRMPGHGGSCQHGRKDCGSGNQFQFGHPFLLFNWVTQRTKCGRERRFRPWFLKDFSGSGDGL